MKHALRKYISPCGSALFMVVSTMAALIVLVTAMYMSVLSSRQVQYATFDQEQAYVSSTSLADAVVAMISNAKSGTPAATLAKTLGNVNSFKVGDHITASGKDLGAVSGGIMDAYDICITRVDDEVDGSDTWFVYDIAVTAEQNGVSETTHTFIRTKPSDKAPVPSVDRFFTATGYVPNDTMISTGMYQTDLYYHSDYVKFSKMVSKDAQPDNINLQSGLVCSGTLELDHDNVANIDLKKPNEWVIGGDLIFTKWRSYFNLGGDVEGGSMIAATKRGKMVVGGDLDSSKSTNTYVAIGLSGKPTDLFVMGNVYSKEQLSVNGNTYVGKDFHSGRSAVMNGNVYVWGDCYLDNNFQMTGDLYVKGNIIVASDAMWLPIKGDIYVGGRIISQKAEETGDMNAYKQLFSGREQKDVDNNWVPTTDTPDKDNKVNELLRWSEPTLPEGGMTMEKVAEHITTKTSDTTSYHKWSVYGGDTAVAIPGQGEVPAAIDIAFCSDSINVIKDTGETSIKSSSIKSAIYKSLGGVEEAEKAFEPTHVVTIKDDCTIHKIYDYGRAANMGPIVTLIIDTGDADTVRKINLQANRDTDGDGVEDTFTWRPIFRIPDTIGGLYEADSTPNSTVNGIKWIEQEDTSNMNYINILTIGDGQLVVNVGDFTYTESVDDDGDPSTPEVNVTRTEPIVYESSYFEFFGHYAWFMFLGGSEKTVNGKPAFQRGSWPQSAADEVMKHIHYSDACDGKSCNIAGEGHTTEVYINGKKKTVYNCSTHGPVYSLMGDPEPIKDKCYCNGKILKDSFPTYKYNNATQQPNVNIFIVSMSESANFRISVKDHNDELIEQNTFFGFFYAPYMTYIDNSGKGRTGLKHTGGMIVSDYIMSGDNKYVFARPDRDLMIMDNDDDDGDGSTPVSAGLGNWIVNGV